MPSPHPPPDRDPVVLKRTVRQRLLAARDERSRQARDEGARAAAEALLDLGEVRSAGTAGCYLGFGSEPATGPLLDGLMRAGIQVLLPVLLPDNDLDWAPYDGPAGLAPGRFGLLEPTAPRLGAAAVADVDVLVVPALAIGPHGERLGRGGGSYDRALARLPATTAVIALVHPGETDVGFPVEPHDRPVDVVVAGSQVICF